MELRFKHRQPDICTSVILGSNSEGFQNCTDHREGALAIDQMETSSFL